MLLNLCLLILFLKNSVQVDPLPSKTEIAEKLYIKLFKRQRAEQLEAIKSFLKISNYEKQHSMIMLMAEKLFSVIQDSRAVIEASSYIPGVSEFPLDDEVRNALSNILENTALYSEIILRFPDTAITVLHSNHNWNILLQWGITFSNQVKYLLDNSTKTLLHLVSQELNIIERDSDYINPYKKMKLEIDPLPEEHRKAKKKRNVIKKGPRLSNHFEL